MTAPVVVVLSGGQDSTTCLFWARKQYPGARVHAITFDYGQRHLRELEAAKKVAQMAKVASHRFVSIAGLLQSSSPLIDHKTPLENYTDPKQMEEVIGNRVELTFVPYRNPMFMLIAANHAHALGAQALVTGVCAMDNANYPDCRPEFLRALAQLFRTSLGTTFDPIHIEAPLLYLTKAESIHLAQKVGAMKALAYSHTCYEGEYPPCGKCHACVLRQDGFAKAEIDDPLLVRAREEKRL